MLQHRHGRRSAEETVSLLMIRRSKKILRRARLKRVPTVHLTWLMAPSNNPYQTYGSWNFQIPTTLSGHASVVLVARFIRTRQQQRRLFSDDDADRINRISVRSLAFGNAHAVVLFLIF
jgi:hypothetical protein